MMETVLLLIFILTIPMAILITEIIFSYDTQHIPPDILETLW